MSNTTEPDYLAATPALDYDNIMLQKFVKEHWCKTRCEKDNAISLYYAVRDSIRYDPYRLDMTINGMKASTTLQHGYGWCVPKAVLLAACCRLMGVPARLGYGDVRNHMSTERLRSLMKTDIFYWHGYTEILIENAWVKATPAFNRELCEKMGVAPLEFNGRDDSVFHPFDVKGNRYMEYIHDRGCFADLPLANILETFECYYPTLLQPATGDFDRDVDMETGKNKS